MVFQWLRIPEDDGAIVASADTTETEIGVITVPSWARSLKAVRIAHTLLALTSDEEVAGYMRFNTDNNEIDPLYLPLPPTQQLAGAQGGHLAEPVIFPLECSLTPEDTLRAYSAYDAATTGVHEMSAYALLSSEQAKFNMHADLSAVQAQSTTSMTGAATKVNIETVTGKTQAIMGIWGYIYAAAGITAGQTCQGFVKITSKLKGWLTQELPLNYQASGLGTDVPTLMKPAVYLPPYFTRERMIQGVHLYPWLEEFGVTGKQKFTFQGFMDGTNTAAPNGRFGLIWRG